MLAELVVIAISIWGGGPAECGYPQIEWQEKIVVSRDFPAVGQPDGTELAGASFHDTCRVILSKSIWRTLLPSEKCDLVAHEDGHLKIPGADPYHLTDAMHPWHRFKACHTRKFRIRDRREENKHNDFTIRR